MANAVFNAPHFHDEAAAFAHVEKMLWPNGPFCPHCGNADGARIGALKGIRTKASKKNPQGIERHGLYKCYACLGQFTVRKGTIFEETHLALHLWLQVIHMMGASKKGISTRQVQRLLNCSMQTAWHLTNRIREIMKPGSSGSVPPLGGMGATVEADETYLGGKSDRKKGRGVIEKKIVMALVERNGAVRSFQIPNVRSVTLSEALAKNLRVGTALMTDDASGYRDLKGDFRSHHRIAHAYGEYVRSPIYTNTVEGFFGILKRGLNGTYQNVSEAHLHRYLSEFDFRYSNREKLGVDDKIRANLMVKNAKGRRLSYERLGEAESSAA